MDIQNLKENLKILIDQLSIQLEHEYLEVIENNNTESITRYTELKTYITLYQSLYETETETEFLELIDEYINISIAVLNKEMEESVENEDYEKCADIKSEIELIKDLKK